MSGFFPSQATQLLRGISRPNMGYSVKINNLRKHSAILPVDAIHFSFRRSNKQKWANSLHNV